MRIFVAIVYKMPVAALQGETAGHFMKSMNQIDDRFVDPVFSDAGKDSASLDFIIGIFCQLFWARKSFHG